MMPIPLHFAGLSGACQCAGKPCAQMGASQQALASAEEDTSLKWKWALLAAGFGLGMIYLVGRM